MSELDRKQNLHRSSVQEQLDMIRTEYQRSGQLPLGLEKLINLLQNSNESKSLNSVRIRELAQAAFSGEDLLATYPTEYAKLVSDEESQKEFIATLQRLESNSLELSFLSLVPPKPTLFINETQQWRCEWVLTSAQLASRLQQNVGNEQIELFSSKFKVPEEEGQITVSIVQQETSIALTITATVSDSCKVEWGSFSESNLSSTKTFTFPTILKNMIFEKSGLKALRITLESLD